MMVERATKATKIKDWLGGPFAALKPLDAANAEAELKDIAEEATERGLERLVSVLTSEGEPRDFLGAVFDLSDFMRDHARRQPETLDRLLDVSIEDRLAEISREIRALPSEDGMSEAALMMALRRLKGEAHFLIALDDLAQNADAAASVRRLSDLAGDCVAAATEFLLLEADSGGKLKLPNRKHPAEGSGWILLGMGKLGAFELNYSSDVDLIVFYDPEKLAAPEPDRLRQHMVRFTQNAMQSLSNRTADGYVFRTDLRLRPDPASTPAAVSVLAAEVYYETMGQNWERAAMIKARPVAADRAAGDAFLARLRPFVWRRSLDFNAIQDIHSIKRQINAHRGGNAIAVLGHNVKLGRGGIREIEFFVQTQQLILGGRHPELRSNRTLDALAALRAAGHVSPETADELSRAYVDLRALEHRAQMLGDDQTHKLPESDGDRKRVAALWGHDNLRTFDAAVGKMLKAVNARYGELFRGEEALSSRFGSLVFTGVEDDPETLNTLKRMGFNNPPQVSQTIRGWHHGRIGATRTERGRELFTRLAPRLLDAAQATGAPEAAFNRFADFFGGLSSGVQVQSLFLAQPKLLELVVQVMAFAPQLAQTLARRPAALDALLDPAFFDPFDTRQGAAALRHAFDQADGFEEAMDAARRVHREQAFRIGVQVMSGTASAQAAGAAFADLADLCIRGLADAALSETARQGGTFEGDVAVVALGKCGGREMTARSDLDLMTLYRAHDPAGTSTIKGWSADMFYARFTQRLIAALSAPTGEGGLYEVDMQLRPTGSKGPVAVSMRAFEDYYDREAETWEMLALTRARVVWATSELFAVEAEAAIDKALRRPRDADRTAADVRDMRELMARERPPSGDWDLKLSEGGLVDIEFAAQFLQIIHAGAGGPLAQNTGDALAALAAGGLAETADLETLAAAWRLQQDLSQLLKLALDDRADPAQEPKALQALLARAGGARDLKGLKTRLAAARRSAHAAYEAVVAGRRHGADRPH